MRPASEEKQSHDECEDLKISLGYLMQWALEAEEFDLVDQLSKVLEAADLRLDDDDNLFRERLELGRKLGEVSDQLESMFRNDCNQPYYSSKMVDLISVTKALLLRSCQIRPLDCFSQDVIFGIIGDMENQQSQGEHVQEQSSSSSSLPTTEIVEDGACPESIRRSRRLRNKTGLHSPCATWRNSAPLASNQFLMGVEIRKNLDKLLRDLIAWLVKADKSHSISSFLSWTSLPGSKADDKIDDKIDEADQGGDLFCYSGIIRKHLMRNLEGPSITFRRLSDLSNKLKELLPLMAEDLMVEFFRNECPEPPLVVYQLDPATRAILGIKTTASFARRSIHNPLKL